MKEYKIIIIGAGASGVGFASALESLKFESYLVIEKGEIGDSFLNWPKETRLITPSFTTNGFGFPDINSIAPSTSPAFTFEKEHLSGIEYGEYLRLVAEAYNLKINTNENVVSIEKDNEHYIIKTDKDVYKATYVVMAVGEFGRANDYDIKGFELGIHYKDIDSFKDFTEEEYVVVGGNESGSDITCNLTSLGKKVTIYTNNFGENERIADPSIALSPITKTKLRNAASLYGFKVFEDHKLKEIQKNGDEYHLTFENEGKIKTIISKTKPLLATGFISQVKQFKNELFEFNSENIPIVNENDESTINPNLFLIGPSLRQQKIIFCYIYKFRQRFMYVISKIAEREGIVLDSEVVENYRKNQMYLTDLSCCSVDCDC